MTEAADYGSSHDPLFKDVEGKRQGGTFAVNQCWKEAGYLKLGVESGVLQIQYGR